MTDLVHTLQVRWYQLRRFVRAYFGEFEKPITIVALIVAFTLAVASVI